MESFMEAAKAQNSAVEPQEKEKTISYITSCHIISVFKHPVAFTV
jgi:hypothetical protein